jgi:DNA-binding XRE family transcriptional regulator
MNKPKIGQKVVDWRAALAKVDRAKYESEHNKAITTIKSFREMRKHLGMTQTDVAEALNVTQSNVSKIESRNVPNLDFLNSIVKGKGRVRVLVELEEGETFEFDVR